jgi:hypothetical protein
MLNVLRYDSNQNIITSNIMKFEKLVKKLLSFLSKEEFGKKLIDKLRYLQANMSQFISYVHWLDRVLLN